MRLPLLSPLFLKLPLVLSNDPFLLLALHAAERRPAPTMYEYSDGAENPSTAETHPQGEIVVCEHADAEAVVEGPDLVKEPAPEGHAIHGQDVDIERFACLRPSVPHC